MNIVLIGYRGTGKSAISKILARSLGRELHSIDQRIVESEGKPIPRIVEESGWPGFRRIEAEMVATVCREVRDGVIECGGGVVLDDSNTRHLRECGKIVLLTADLETILKRIRNDSNRPPLKDGLSFEEEQKQILAEREGKYLAAADLKFDTTWNKPGKTARQIMYRFKKNGWL